ncbi:MAG: tRNA guanosine(15) transglycosylase TgtA [Thermoplasmata archaeon]|nr:tRNA guanosine(15) transglycosylase TgtA [Thermoplasmata archaeon]
MGGFELRERDGLARIGRLETPHGAIETPALLPVIHPDPTRQPVAPTELRRRFGLGAVITSAYITWRTPPLKEIAEEKGIHGLLQFDGPVMTDSGAFQQHAYGHVEVEPDRILAFQGRIGSDIATVLDIFVEPTATEAEARAGVELTTVRAKQARLDRTGLLAVPVQGGLFPELRFQSALEASTTGDILAVGGVVPLLEQYRFPDLARVLLAARPALAPEKVVHLFGTGHPASFAFAALFGVDLFDSSSYLKFARRGSLLFPEGTVPLERIREATCRCFLCEETPLTKLAGLPAEERERRLSEHNLLMCAQEISVVRQAIRDGALWELVERRAGNHPALQAGLRAAVRGTRVFLPAEPESRTSFRVVGSTSGLRPSVIRFLARLRSWRSGKGEFRPHPWVPLIPSTLRRTPTRTRAGEPIRWECFTALGPVPLELTELYPVGCYVGLDEFDDGPSARKNAFPPGDSLDLTGLDVEEGVDWGDPWTQRQVMSSMEWRYGPESVAAFVGAPLTAERSARSGRLRSISWDGSKAFIYGNDGVPRPTWFGALKLHPLLPFPASRIIVDPDAAPFVAAGKSLFSRFVRGGDSALVPGSSAFVVDPDDRLLAVGRLVLAPYEMGRITRGVAVRVTAHARAHGTEPEDPEELPEPPTFSP